MWVKQGRGVDVQPRKVRAPKLDRTPPAPWTLHARSGIWRLYTNPCGLWAAGDGEAWFRVPAARVAWWLGEFGLSTLSEAR